ncbi:hypothetical protein NC652_018824 [Populus alba x Populus x berolinensis]|nr:hypothetical protein NC652_018824 [Populus alba x Populus x berolinensis]
MNGKARQKELRKVKSNPPIPPPYEAKCCPSLSLPFSLFFRRYHESCDFGCLDRESSETKLKTSWSFFLKDSSQERNVYASIKDTQTR